MSIGTAVSQLVKVVSDPTSNITATALLLAMVVLVLLILAVAALVSVLPGAGEPEDDESGEPAPDDEPAEAEAVSDQRRDVGRRVPASALTAVALVAIAVAAGWGWSMTGSSERCASCHATQSAAKSWKSSGHRGVACTSCHEDGGIGVVSAAISRASDLISADRAAGIGRDRPVPSYRCVGCHRAVLGRTIKQGAILMRHAEPIAAGYDCTRCHPQAGHARVSNVRGMMNQCLGCHDGTKASAACPTCHTESPRQVRADPSIYPKADIVPRPGCTGCHDTSRCTACHGLVMPHPDGFGAAQGHARLGAFERKRDLCFRCHEASDCLRCHKSTFDAHAPNWKQVHGRGLVLGRQRGCSCHRTVDFCALCHAEYYRKR